MTSFDQLQFNFGRIAPQPFTLSQASARLEQHLPAIVGGLEKERLDLSTRHPPAVEAGRDDARVVQHQAVAAVEIVADVAKYAMLDRARSAINHQQPRGVARPAWSLSDQLRRQVILKLGKSQRWAGPFQIGRRITIGDGLAFAVT